MAGLGQLNSALGYQDTDKQLAVGNQQQANTQAGLDAAQQNAQQAQLWDQQQTQWLAGITAGTAPLMGGTTTTKHYTAGNIKDTTTAGNKAMLANEIDRINNQQNVQMQAALNAFLNSLIVQSTTVIAGAEDLPVLAEKEVNLKR